MHLAVCAHYVLLPSVDIKKLTGQKQNQMHQKPFADFSTKLSPNWKENPWTVNPIKGCPRSCSSSSCCNFTRVICSPIYCPVPLSEELLQQQQSTGSHSLTPSLPPSRQALSWQGLALPAPGHSWAPLGPGHHHPSSPHLHSLERGRKGRDNLKAPEHTCQTHSRPTHTSVHRVAFGHP